MADEHVPTPTPTVTPPQDQTQQYPPTSQTPPTNQTPEQTTPPGPKTPPAPPGDTSDCPPPKPCVTWPTPPCPPRKKPDPCTVGEEPECTPSGTGVTPPVVVSGNCCELPAGGSNPATQLGALRAQLTAEQRQADQIERVKASIEDLTTRIGELQKVIDARATRGKDFEEFYRGAQVTASEARCAIPTIRCQHDLRKPQMDCITAAIAGVDAVIAAAKAQLDTQRGLVDRAEARMIRAQWNADWTQRHFEFLDSKLKERVQKHLDDLAALQPLADPAGDRCVAEFYLREMETLLESCYGTNGSNCCWVLDKMTVGSFVDCWSEQCYADMYNQAVVENNNAAWSLKCRTALYESAQTRLEEYQKAYDELLPKRRDLILAALKDSDCCKITSPTGSTSSTAA